MKALIKIEMDNAAFEDNGRQHELAIILRTCAEKILREPVLDESTSIALMDSNGNRVGRLVIEE